MPLPSRSISQQQIANDLGYSQSFVSRVLNGQHAGLPEETVQRIWTYAREHGYRPRGINLDLLVADSVATPLVGFVLRSPLRLVNESSVFAHARQGMHDYLYQRNIRTVYLGAEAEIDAAALVASVERHQLMLGLALMGEVQPGFISGVAACRKPVVMVSARYPGLCHSVVSNLRQAATLLVDHLHQLGHRRFGWIGSVHGLGRMLLHKEAVVQALAARGLQLAAGCQFDLPEADRRHGQLAVAQLLRAGRAHLPTALICHNAMLARGAINHLFQHGLTVPGDVSVAAIDMTQVCTEESPQITSAAARPEALGARAAELIIACAEKRDRSLCELILPSELAVRESTAAVRAAVAAPLLVSS